MTSAEHANYSGQRLRDREERGRADELPIQENVLEYWRRLSPPEMMELLSHLIVLTEEQVSESGLPALEEDGMVLARQGYTSHELGNGEVGHALEMIASSQNRSNRPGVRPVWFARLSRAFQGRENEVVALDELASEFSDPKAAQRAISYANQFLKDFDCQIVHVTAYRIIRCKQ